jgi:hypothetical protein
MPAVDLGGVALHHLSGFSLAVAHRASSRAASRKKALSTSYFPLAPMTAQELHQPAQLLQCLRSQNRLAAIAFIAAERKRAIDSPWWRRGARSAPPSV